MKIDPVREFQEFLSRLPGSRIRFVFRDNKVTSFEALEALSENDLLKFKNFGKVSLKILKDRLKLFGRRLRLEDEVRIAKKPEAAPEATLLLGGLALFGLGMLLGAALAGPPNPVVIVIQPNKEPEKPKRSRYGYGLGMSMINSIRDELPSEDEIKTPEASQGSQDI